jgi:hypothetical protein
VRTYIHGALYSLLTSPEIHSEAVAMGLEEVIIAQMEVSDGNLVVQLQYILQQLNGDPPKRTNHLREKTAVDGVGADFSDDDEADELEGEDEDDSDDLMIADASAIFARVLSPLVFDWLRACVPR